MIGVTATSLYSSTDYNSPYLGALMQVSTDAGTVTPYGTLAPINAMNLSIVPGTAIIQIQDTEPTNPVPTGLTVFGGTWSWGLGSTPGSLQVLVVSDGAGSSTGEPVIGTVTYTRPTVEFVYDSQYQRVCSNIAPQVTIAQSDAAVKIVTDSPVGTVAVPGSSFVISDESDDAHTYTLAAASEYFSINQDTGDITTLHSNTPVGSYELDAIVTDGFGAAATVSVVINVVAGGSSVASTRPAESLAATGVSVFFVM